MTSSEHEMRDLPLDDYIAWMLNQGYYDAEVHTGRVINPRSGQELRPTRHGRERNYLGVQMVYSSRVIRRVAVHRVVAIKAWGVEAVRGKHVGHRDGDPSHNAIDNLWLPETPREHVRADNSDRGFIPQPRKEAWAPCVRCGTEGGPIIPKGHTPIRISGQRFGIDGALCGRCYGTLAERARRARISAESVAQEVVY